MTNETSVRLNKFTDAASRTLTGSAFHAAGPATVKERSPNLVRVRGSIKTHFFVVCREQQRGNSVAPRGTRRTVVQELRLVLSGTR